MAAEDQGIMSLPMEGEAASQNMSQMPLEESYGAVQEGLQNASPQAAADIQQLMAGIMPQLDQLSDEELSAFLETIEYLYEGGEAQYAKRLQEVISSGVLDTGDLPEEYDPEVLSSIGAVLLEALRTRQGAMAQEPMPPAQFARGGIAEAARMVASKGRYGDTMLAHITPEEARLLKSRGGSGTINPETGLPEFFLKKAFKSIANVAKKVVKSVVKQVKTVLKSPIGRVLATVALATFLGPGAFGITGLGLGAAAAPLASGIVTLASGGNLKQALIAGATAYFGAPGGTVSQYVGAAGITNAAANAAVTAGIVGTGTGLLSGQKLQDAVKTGLAAGAVSGLSTGVQQGFMSDVPGTAPRTDLPEVVDRGTMLEATQGVTTPQAVSRSVAQGAAGTVPAGMRVNTETGELYRPLTDTVARSVTPPVATGTPVAAAAEVSPFAPLQAPPGAPGGAAAPTPGIGQSLRTIGGGISDLAQGRPGAFETIKQGASDLFMPKTFTPTELRTSDAYTAARAAGATDAAALAEAGKAMNPSILRSYGPAVGAGLGIMGLSGGFQPSPVAPSALGQRLRGTPGQDLINRAPGQYLVQGLPGVQYSEQGDILGTSNWSPSASMTDVRVATPNYFAPASAAPTPGIASLYTPGPGTLGLAGRIGQPGNTAAMYGNLMPRMTGYDPYGYFRAADGGLASFARGGYPRKTGAISGPGTEKSDSIPAMLSDGEFVMTAKAVRGAGGGSRREGAKKMYALMHQLERNASRG